MSKADPPPRYTCVLFDVDNTLVDTDALIRAALSDCGCPQAHEISDAELRSSSPLDMLKRRGCGHAVASYWRRYDALAVSKARLLDADAPEVLEALRQRGVALGVVTSCRKPTMEALLRATDILRFFAGCLVTYGTCRHRKPHPEPIQYALRTLGHEPSAALYVGDAEKDRQASHAAGIQFGLAGWARLTEEEMAALMPDIVLDRIANLFECT